jgi:tRNA-2-methylthio-N6-dimethylallyladenosine synthase
VEVLVDGASRRDPERLKGKTRTHKTVVLDGGKDLLGRIVSVQLTDADAWTLHGTVRPETRPRFTAGERGRRE